MKQPKKPKPLMIRGRVKKPPSATIDVGEAVESIAVSKYKDATGLEWSEATHETRQEYLDAAAKTFEKIWHRTP